MKKATMKLIVSTSAPNRVSNPTTSSAAQTTSANTTSAGLVACPTPSGSGKLDDIWLKPLSFVSPWLSDKVRPSQMRNTSSPKLVQADAVPGAKIFLSIGVWVENFSDGLAHEKSAGGNVSKWAQGIPTGPT